MNYLKFDIPQELIDIYGSNCYINFEIIHNPIKEISDSYINEILKRDNSEELKKEIIILKDKIYHVLNVITDSEYKTLVDKIGEEGMWYILFCTEDEIINLLHPKNTYDILLKLRADNIVDYPRLVRIFKKRKEDYLYNSNTWSLTSYYSEYDCLFDKYIEVLNPNIREECKNVARGFIPMREINGVCSKTPFGNIIFLSEYLKEFLFFMNLSILNFEGYPIDKKTRRESLLLALRIMLVSEVPDFDLDPRYDSLPQGLVDHNDFIVENQLLFIIGHEYAHHTLNHLKDTQVLNIKSTEIVQNTKYSETVVLYNQMQLEEFDADYHSFKNVEFNTYDENHIADGAFSFFIYIDIYEHVKEYIFPSNKLYKRHPSPIDRIYELRKRINPEIGYSNNQIEKMILNAKNIKESLNEDLSYNTEIFEDKGSIYLSEYKTSFLVDRIDY